jgi:Protein of unknown function (DUF2384)
MNSMSDREAALCAVIELNGDRAAAAAWSRSEALPALDGRTPALLCDEGGVDDALRYIEVLDTGFCG